MATTINERRAYSRGYSRGMKSAWPPHKPPMPPDALLAAFALAARELRDAVDSVCATFGEDDELALSLGVKINALDAQMSLWTEWLQEREADDLDSEIDAALAAQKGAQ